VASYQFFADAVIHSFFVFSLFLLSSKHAKSFSNSSGKRAKFTEAALLRMSRLLFVGSYLQFLRPIKTTEKII
jgi:hypothetical protein